jgi:hypothetical protein
MSIRGVSDGSKDTPSAHQRHQDIPDHYHYYLWTFATSVFYPKEIINMTIRMTQSAILMLALIGSGAFAFNPSCVQVQTPFRLASKNLSPTRDVTLQASRRSFVETFALSTIAVAGGASLLPEQASASGGATAGGVYLLSAKQRYNGRVTKGVKGFLSLGGSVESGNIDYAINFFKSEEDGNWKDFSAAAICSQTYFVGICAAHTLPSVKVRTPCGMQMHS